MMCGNNQRLNRRAVLKSTGAASAAALAGCIGGSGDGKPDSLVFGVWGGTWQDLCQKSALDPFTEETDINIEFVLGGESERFNKLVAQPDNPPTDATQLPLEYLQRGENEDMWHSLDSDLVPVYEDVPDKVKGDGWLAHHFTASALVYNTNTFDEPPQDMGIFLNEDYKGRIALAEPTQRSPAFDLMAFSLYKTNGETFKDIEAGFEMYENIVKNMDPKFAGATEQYGKWFSNDTIDVARIWAARSASWAADGTPINYQIPANGAMMYSAGHAIPKNIPENKLDWAGELIQSFYTPEASKEFASSMFYPTVNPAVEYPDDVNNAVPTMDDIDDLQLPDYSWLGENREEWTNRANEIINEYQ